MTIHTLHENCKICGKPLGSKKRALRGFQVCGACNNKTPPDEHRCEYIRDNTVRTAPEKRGTRCKKWKVEDSDYCKMHGRWVKK